MLKDKDIKELYEIIEMVYTGFAGEDINQWIDKNKSIGKLYEKLSLLVEQIDISTEYANSMQKLKEKMQEVDKND